jgi:hypothetical protein
VSFRCAFETYLGSGLLGQKKGLQTDKLLAETHELEVREEILSLTQLIGRGHFVYTPVT